MSLQDVQLKISYDSDEDNILQDFYLPVLQETVLYQRIAGFFSSTCFAVAAQGVTGLIANHGKMQLIVSPRLSEADIAMMKKAVAAPEQIIAQVFGRDIDRLLEDDSIQAMGWMLANHLLEIKVGVVFDDKHLPMTADEIEQTDLFHIKTGVFHDKNGNVVAFNGSVNESYRGWQKNTESFSVFCSWREGQAGYCEAEEKRFQRYWQGGKNHTKVFSLPDAIQQKLIKNAPKELDDVKLFQREKKKRNLASIALYSYQRQAVQAWIQNKGRILLEMATGTGKTRTALACMYYALQKVSPLIVVINTPQNTISMQWKCDIEKQKVYQGKIIVADGSNRTWKKDVDKAISYIRLQQMASVVIISCTPTFASETFCEMLQATPENIKILFIGDEVHGLGAVKNSQGLLKRYNYRIGLSATPSRWLDDYGTKLIEDYFDHKKFTFSMRQALTTINPSTGRTFLTKYYYYPVFVHLNDSEAEDYGAISHKIARLFYSKKNDKEKQKQFERLLMKRAEIYKNAEAKIPALTKILDAIGEDIRDTIIYVSDKQIQQVITTLSERGIRCAAYTKDQGTKPEKKYGGISEREVIIRHFKQHDLQVLVAIKALDEGIDIPSAKRAIIMASSTNPREFIQRIGRVIRAAEGKTYAEIYDMVVTPDPSKICKEALMAELKIFAKEQNRIEEIASNAINSTDVLILVNQEMRRIHQWS